MPVVTSSSDSDCNCLSHIAILPDSGLKSGHPHLGGVFRHVWREGLYIQAIQATVRELESSSDLWPEIEYVVFFVCISVYDASRGSR